MLEMKHVTKQFRRKKVLDNVTGDLEEGIYGLVGANGAGKTTLIRCLTGLYRVNQGAILWNGTDIRKSKSFPASVGYLPQKFGGLKDLRVEEFLKYFGDLKKMDQKSMDQRIPEVLKTVNLEDRVKSRVRTLSGGMVRRLGIAQALLNDPELLIFDEPTAGLDPEERLRFKNIMTNIPANKTVMISTHIVEDIESVCDKIIVVKEGKLLGIFTVAELAHKALGMVYEVTEQEQGNLQGKYKVIREYYSRNQKVIRILSGIPQSSKPVEPTVEDGYLWLISEKEEIA